MNTRNPFADSKGISCIMALLPSYKLLLRWKYNYSSPHEAGRCVLLNKKALCRFLHKAFELLKPLS